MFLIFILGFALLGIMSPSPIQYKIEAEFSATSSISRSKCTLPPEMGHEGTLVYLEDCESLPQHPNVLPKPPRTKKKVSVHPLVCCPKLRLESDICFRSDSWCPTNNIISDADEETYDDIGDATPQAGTSVDYDYYGVNYDQGTVRQHEFRQNDPQDKFLMSSRACENSNTTCVTIHQCPDFLTGGRLDGDHDKPCGFNETQQLTMICCPTEHVQENGVNLSQSPLYPDPYNGGPRLCEDRHEMCAKWSLLGGCRLDKEHKLGKDDLPPFIGTVTSLEMFDFMQSACPKTCGWCGRKGCVNEHHNCPSWARNAECIKNPHFMAHTCRESCGLCGFLSPFNKEEQIIGDRSYTDINNKNFDCGREIPVCKFNKEPCEEEETETKDIEEEIIEEIVDNSVHFSTDKETALFGCGVSTIADRWAVSAAHCVDNYEPFSGLTVNVFRQGKTNATYVIETKRFYVHPFYKVGQLYNDIAIFEFGRRTIEDFDKYGDTPECLGNPQLDKAGEFAEVSHNKEVRDEEFDKVQIIDTDECEKQIKYNVSNSAFQDQKGKINTALPYGLNVPELLCSRGIKKGKNKEGKDLFSGPCKGDSGSRLLKQDSKERKTMIGIVSGGVGCRTDTPHWYTRVSHFRSWISCIINRSLLFGGNKEKTDEACRAYAEETPEGRKIFDIDENFA